MSRGIIWGEDKEDTIICHKQDYLLFSTELVQKTWYTGQYLESNYNVECTANAHCLEECQVLYVG